MSPSSERAVVLPADLHARPAGQLSQAVARLGATVTLSVNGKQVDGRSVLLVMSLGATRGAEVTVRAEGEGADQAVELLTGMLLALSDDPPPE